MNSQLITIVVYAVLVIVVLVLEHFHILPDSSLNTIITLILGHAAGTNTLIPSGPPEQSQPIQEEIPSMFTGRLKDGTFPPYPSNQSPPDVTTFPTVHMPVVNPQELPIVQKLRIVNTQDTGERG